MLPASNYSNMLVDSTDSSSIKVEVWKMWRLSILSNNMIVFATGGRERERKKSIYIMFKSNKKLYSIFLFLLNQKNDFSLEFLIIY